jgi:NAD-reducing hydrogenase small subunit
MRNPFGVKACMDRAYIENAQLNQQHPSQVIPKLLERVRPVHEVVKVDAFIPGCPPHADVIFAAVTALVEGRTPDLSQARFG